MNFYNEDEKKDGAAAPGAFKKTSSFGKTPLFSRTAGGLMDRLKNLSRKDMAFVGIGLSVLVMAPVAEYMMSKPSTDNILTPGFGSREGGAPTGLYEPGINALSQGSPDGSGEVITPLSSRDPASLILGSQSSAPAMPPPSAPPTTFRDSMKDVGRAAFSEASKAAPSPTPIPRMQAALRGMSSFFGGGDSTRTSGTLGGGKIIDDAKSASSKAAKRSMVGPVAMPGYKGVASNTPNSSSKGAFEKLRSAADKSAGNFTGGSAISSLDKAAADAPTVGAGGGGMGYGGDSEKTGKTSPYNNKYEHSRSGESLAEMAAKQRMQKALDWEFYKQYEIPKQLINAILTGITGPLTKFVDGTMTHILGMDPPPGAKCWVPFICPDGNCSKYIEEAKAKGVNPIKYTCEYAGAIKVKTVVGKESASYSKDFCLCGEKAEPTFGSNVEAGGVGTGGNPPPVNPPPTDNPQGGQGSQISQNMAELFKKYDDAFLALMGRVIELESDLAKNQPETVVKPKVEGLANAFVTLDELARGDVKKTLTGLQFQANTAVTEYGRVYNEKKARFDTLNSEYKDYAAAVKRIEADIKDKKLKPAVTDGIAADPTASATAMTDLFATHNKVIDTGMAGAEGLIMAHGKRYEAYTKQLQVVGGSIDSLMGEHASVPSGAKAFLAAEGPLPQRLASATGREPVAVQQAAAEQPQTAAAGATKAADVTGAKTGEEAASADQAEAPLKKAALKLRAVDDWDKMWKNKTFESGVAGKKEEAEWKAYDKTVTGDSPAALSAPGNFVANALRSGEIGTAAGDLTDLKKNISGMMDSAQVHMVTVKNSAATRVHKCYFSKAGCSNVQENEGGGGAHPQLPPTLTEAQKIRVNQANLTHKEAGREYKAAGSQVESMEAAIPGTPYAEARGDAAKKYATLTSAKNDLDKAKVGLDAAAQSGDRKKTSAAADAYEAAAKQYDAAQAAFEKSHEVARATTNGMKWTGLRSEANANFQTIMRCNNKCTNPTTCKANPNASRVTEILSVAPNQLQLVEAAGTSDERRLSAAEGLRTGRATACMWVKRAMKITVQGCQ